MQQERWQDFLPGTLELSSEHFDPVAFAEAMDLETGLGMYTFPAALRQQQIDFVNEEVFDPERVPLRDNHKPFFNKRGRGEQRHDVYALKLSRGDEEPVKRVPRMRLLARETSEFIRRHVTPVFPQVSSYTPDEMSVHRYDDPEIGISFHKDQTNFIYLIAILTLEGSRVNEVIGPDDEIHQIPIELGSLSLTRAMDLFPRRYESKNGELMLTNDCPDHSTGKLQTEFSTSFIVRANCRPDEPIKGFTYDNWDGE